MSFPYLSIFIYVTVSVSTTFAIYIFFYLRTSMRSEFKKRTILFLKNKTLRHILDIESSTTHLALVITVRMTWTNSSAVMEFRSTFSAIPMCFAVSALSN